MKKARYGAAQIPMPDAINNPMLIGQLSRQIRKAIAALRDRPVLVAKTTPHGVAPTHPWKVTANGNDTVKVNWGAIYAIEATSTGGLPNITYDTTLVTYDGTADLTVTGDGWIVATVALESRETSFESTLGQNWSFNFIPDAGAVTPIAVECSPIIGSGQTLYLKLASVTLTDGVAAVVRQYMTYCPMIQFGYTITDSP